VFDEENHGDEGQVEEGVVEDELVYGINNLSVMPVESSAGSASDEEHVLP
jgi:hypothetical protein